MKTEEIVTILFAGVNGYLDKIAEKEILNFEKGWVEFVRGNKGEILEEIRTKKAISDDLKERMHSAVQEFVGTQDFALRV
jgi:F-type H+-transporting ATPase subunit alpha